MMDNKLPTECCAKCRFAGPPLDCDDPPAIAECKRFPPLFFSGSGQGSGDDTDVNNWHRPVVLIWEWCGEFQPRQAKKP